MPHISAAAGTLHNTPVTAARAVTPAIRLSFFIFLSSSDRSLAISAGPASVCSKPRARVSCLLFQQYLASCLLLQTHRSGPRVVKARDVNCFTEYQTSDQHKCPCDICYCKSDVRHSLTR